MAKKLTAKERRQMQEQNKRKVIQENNEERERKAEEERERKEQEKFQREIQKLEEKDKTLGKVKKSQAKAAGLKSTFRLNDSKILMTSFGNGNAAVREVGIQKDEVTTLAKEPVLSVAMKPEENAFLVSGRQVKDAVEDDPRCSKKKTGQDLIFCKEKLEKIYFGQEFEDNVHIQLIHNILDIEKILAPFVNNIVYEVNNLMRKGENEKVSDLIGSLGLRKTYERFGKKAELSRLLTQKQLGYFGDILLKWNNESEEEHVKRCYYLLATIGMMRQATAHGDLNRRSLIFRLDKIASGEDTVPEDINQDAVLEAEKYLDKLYGVQVRKLNEGFLENSYKDIRIINTALGRRSEKEKNQTAQEYYRFIVIKEHKNLGFSIKRLRETMVGEYAGHISDKEYDTVRRKLNHILDFMIYSLYQMEENAERGKSLIEHLRASRKESEKELFYRKEAEFVWSSLETIIDKKVLPMMNGDEIKGLGKGKIEKSVIETVCVKEKAHLFCEMIYLITLFQDGKEINDLLTQLINRLENIQSFLQVMREGGIPCDFEKEHLMLNECEVIIKELRIINSFARMTKTAPEAKKALFLEAAELLGYKEERTELEAYMDEVLDPEKGKRKSNGEKDNGFRNFIINNVIESDRFKYLVRYGDPKKIRKMANNKKVMSFVLKQIPNEQIRSYYNSCNDMNLEYSEDMRADLASKITYLSFHDFTEVHQENTENQEWAKDKERKKNIVRLYLTVLYLLQKNLVYVNSRYYLGFHCAERDAIVYDGTKYSENTLKEDWSMFARDFVEKHKKPEEYEKVEDWKTPEERKRKKEFKKKKRVYEYLKENFGNSDKEVIKQFRNCVEHLNVVRDAADYMEDIQKFDSYFELYHYLVQRYLREKFKGENKPRSAKMESYFVKMEFYHTYCKDMVKALNVPFAYNLPRYKNLSINELFDRNHYLENREKMKAELRNDD